MERMHFHQAIITKYLYATATKPARIRASCQAGSITLSADTATGLDMCEKHARVAMALVRKLGWVPTPPNRYSPEWRAGEIPGYRAGFVFVAGGSAVPVSFTGEEAADAA